MSVASSKTFFPAFLKTLGLLWVLYFTKTAFTKLHRPLLEKIFTIIVLVYASIERFRV
jgi:hypothetical protein